MYQARAQRIADKFYQDMKITDEATKAKIRTAYYNRAKRMGEMKAKYTADTTGMAAANREAMMATDTEFKGILTDPTQYQSYESSRTTYDESNYMDDNSAARRWLRPMAAAGSTTTDNAMSNSNMSSDNMSSTDARCCYGRRNRGERQNEDGRRLQNENEGERQNENQRCRRQQNEISCRPIKSVGWSFFKPPCQRGGLFLAHCCATLMLLCRANILRSANDYR